VESGVVNHIVLWHRPYTAAQRGHYARCWRASGAVRLLVHTGLRESRPGYGLRQQRRVHALLGGNWARVYGGALGSYEDSRMP
jgi:hypothetical protein